MSYADSTQVCTSCEHLKIYHAFEGDGPCVTAGCACTRFVDPAPAVNLARPADDELRFEDSAEGDDLAVMPPLPACARCAQLLTWKLVLGYKLDSEERVPAADFLTVECSCGMAYFVPVHTCDPIGGATEPEDWAEEPDILDDLANGCPECGSHTWKWPPTPKVCARCGWSANAS